MTSFSWKRKAGAKVSRSASAAFQHNAFDDEEADQEALEDIDWLTLAPKRKVLVLEDARAKSLRLRDEGAVLAQEERYWEACKKFDQALELTPYEEQVFEMKAQAYMCLNEVYPALSAAERAVQLNPRWWVAHQTLGRAQLGLGEVRKAVRSFSCAVHLNPDDKDMWEEDLRWAADLLHKKKFMQESLLKEQEKQGKASIVELDTDENSTCTDIVAKGSQKHQDELPSSLKSPENSSTNSLPGNYIKMRDSL